VEVGENEYHSKINKNVKHGGKFDLG